MTETTASVAASPPAPSADVRLHQPSFFWTRLYTWAFSVGLLSALFVAITRSQPAFAWPIAALLGLLISAYVLGARAVDIVSIVQSSGLLRAAQATATAVTNVANTVSTVAGAVLPAPTTGGRNDLAS